jgi:hypothetical protein
MVKQHSQDINRNIEQASHYASGYTVINHSKHLLVMTRLLADAYTSFVSTFQLLQRNQGHADNTALVLWDSSRKDMCFLIAQHAANITHITFLADDQLSL